MDDIIVAIDLLLAEVPTHTVGEFVRTRELLDWLLDLRSIAEHAREAVPA